MHQITENGEQIDEVNKVNFIKDEQKLLEIFSPELWALVLDKVNEKQEVANLLPFFRSVMSTKRTEFLFPQVWKLLAFRMEFMWRIKDKEMRLVCKTWRSEIDSLRQKSAGLDKTRVDRFLFSWDADDNAEWTLDYGYAKRARMHERIFNPYQPEQYQIEKFLAEFPDLGMNPFSDRCCNFEISQFNLEEFGPKVEALLTRFGKHVWYLGIAVVDRIDPLVVFAAMRRWVTLTPNLRSWSFQENDLGDMLQARSEEICTLLEREPMPKLPFLKCILMPGMPARSTRLFLEPNNHVETVHLGGHHRLRCFREICLDFPNLKEINIYLYREADTGLFEDLAPRWQLQTVNLIVKFRLNASTLQRVFRALETWRETLTTLVLETGPIPDIVKVELDLPNIKYLDLKCFSIPLETFSTMKRLEVLVVHPRRLEELPFHQFGYEEDKPQGPYSSLIWRVFPNLKRLSDPSYKSYFRRYVNQCK